MMFEDGRDESGRAAGKGRGLETDVSNLATRPCCGRGSAKNHACARFSARPVRCRLVLITRARVVGRLLAGRMRAGIGTARIAMHTTSSHYCIPPTATSGPPA